MARGEIYTNSLSRNTVTVSTGLTALSTDGNFITCDDFSKLVVVLHNRDTAACTFSISSTSSGSDFIAKGQGSLSTSVGSSEYMYLGPFESARFKSTSKALWIDTTSTASTLCKAYAWILP